MEFFHLSQEMQKYKENQTLVNGYIYMHAHIHTHTHTHTRHLENTTAKVNPNFVWIVLFVVNLVKQTLSLTHKPRVST